MLTAPTAPPPAVIEMLSRHKAGILALLRPAVDGWSALDWLTFFDERARMAAVQGLTSIAAEVRAFACCIVEWLNRNPARSSLGRCLACSRADHSQDPLLPFGTESSGHVWLHFRCWPAWHTRRKVEAVAALKAMGITPPAGFPDDFGKNGRT